MKPVRVRLSRKKGWKLPPDTVSVARPGRWGNPFSVAPEAVPGTPVGTRGGRQYTAMPVQARETLRGKNLACWCALDGPCHAEILLEIANR